MSNVFFRDLMYTPGHQHTLSSTFQPFWGLPQDMQHSGLEESLCFFLLVGTNSSAWQWSEITLCKDESLLDVVYLLYDLWIIILNSPCYNTGQHQTGAKRRSHPTYWLVLQNTAIIKLLEITLPSGKSVSNYTIIWKLHVASGQLLAARVSLQNLLHWWNYMLVIPHPNIDELIPQKRPIIPALTSCFHLISQLLVPSAALALFGGIILS